MSYRLNPDVIPKSPKGWLKKQICHCVNKNQFKSNELCYKVSSCENVKRQSCSKTMPISNAVHMFAVNVRLQFNT